MPENLRRHFQRLNVNMNKKFSVRKISIVQKFSLTSKTELLYGLVVASIMNESAQEDFDFNHW